MALCDTQEIKRDAKLIDLKQRVSTMCENEDSIFRRSSRMGNWLKMVISLFPTTIPDGHVVVEPESCTILVNNKDPVTVNEWLPNSLKFLKHDAYFNEDILQEMQNLLKTRRKEQRIAELRRLKECRNEKLANDIISMNEMIIEMKKMLNK